MFSGAVSGKKIISSLTLLENASFASRTHQPALIPSNAARSPGRKCFLKDRGFSENLLPNGKPQRFTERTLALVPRVKYPHCSAPAHAGLTHLVCCTPFHSASQTRRDRHTKVMTTIREANSVIWGNHLVAGLGSQTACARMAARLRPAKKSITARGFANAEDKAIARDTSHGQDNRF